MKYYEGFLWCALIGVIAIMFYMLGKWDGQEDIYNEAARHYSGMWGKDTYGNRHFYWAKNANSQNAIRCKACGR